MTTNPPYNPYMQQRVPRLPRRRTKRRKAPRWLPYALVAGGAAAVIFTLLVGVGVLAAVALAPERIAAGVKVAGVDVGGKTLQDAEAALRAAAPSSVTATDGDRTWTVGLADLGVTIDEDAMLDALEGARRNASLLPVYRVDLNQTQAGLISLSEQTNIDAMPGDPPQIGRSLDIPVILDRLRLDAAGELADGVLELNMITIEPPELEPVVRYTGETTTHVVERGQELALIAQQYGVTMDDIVAMNDISNPDLLYVGQELVVPAEGEYTPPADQIPTPPTNRGKALVVSVEQQRLYAFENGEMVHSHLVSTGLPETPTVYGDFEVYVKYVADDMRGPDYFLPQVPYTMYFYQGYGIHGTYWHNSFGRPMSHGCVNLPVDEAEWFFNWAEVGTPVRVV